MQASLAIIKEILKIKKHFPQLSDKKVKEVYKMIINSSKPKMHINMTTKKPLWKQIIIPMDSNNISIFMRTSGEHVSSMNCALKSVKSNNFVNFIHSDHWDLIVISNKVASPSDLLVIKSYIKKSKLYEYQWCTKCTFTTIKIISQDLWYSVF